MHTLQEQHAANVSNLEDQISRFRLEKVSLRPPSLQTNDTMAENSKATDADLMALRGELEHGCRVQDSSHKSDKNEGLAEGPGDEFIRSTDGLNDMSDIGQKAE